MKSSSQIGAARTNRTDTKRADNRTAYRIANRAAHSEFTTFGLAVTGTTLLSPKYLKFDSPPNRPCLP